MHATRLLNTREAASYLKLSRKTLERWRWEGKGPRFAKFGGAVRYARGELDDYVERQTRQSTSARS